ATGPACVPGRPVTILRGRPGRLPVSEGRPGMAVRGRSWYTRRRWPAGDVCRLYPADRLLSMLQPGRTMTENPHLMLLSPLAAYVEGDRAARPALADWLAERDGPRAEAGRRRAAH